MKITISVECEKDTEAHEVINLLTRRHNTWLDHKAEVRTEAEAKAKVEEVKLEKVTKDVVNVSPGWKACSRIGGETKEALLNALPSSDTEHIAKKIKRKEEDVKSFLQLLWDRGEIKYDGEEFTVEDN